MTLAFLPVATVAIALAVVVVIGVVLTVVPIQVRRGRVGP